MNFKQFSILLLISSLTLSSLAHAQRKLPLCKTICKKPPTGSACSPSALAALARTPCFDTRTRRDRTCDCNLRPLQERTSATFRDCVIPNPIKFQFNPNTEISINMNLINVMFAGVNTPQGVTMNGFLESSSMCDWTCGSSRSSARCKITGNMVSNHFNFLNAGNNVLDIVSKQFQSNKIGFAKGSSVSFDSNGGRSILFNSIDSLFSTQSNGELLVKAGTTFERNRFIVLTFDKVNIKGTLNRNDATIAEVRKSCSGPSVLIDKIRARNLKLPSRSNCLRIFKQD